MDYLTFKAECDRLESEVEAASAALNAFPSGPTGLTPDAVKAGPEWKAAYNAFWAAHGRLRGFNGRYAAKFKAERRADRAS